MNISRGVVVVVWAVAQRDSCNHRTKTLSHTKWPAACRIYEYNHTLLRTLRNNAGVWTCASRVPYRESQSDRSWLFHHSPFCRFHIMYVGHHERAGCIQVPDQIQRGGGGHVESTAVLWARDLHWLATMYSTHRHDQPARPRIECLAWSCAENLAMPCPAGNRTALGNLMSQDPVVVRSSMWMQPCIA